MMFQSGPMGLVGSLGAVSKVILLLLFLFSVISWAIILYKWRAFRSSDREDQRFLAAYAIAKEKDELHRPGRRQEISRRLSDSWEPCSGSLMHFGKLGNRERPASRQSRRGSRKR